MCFKKCFVLIYPVFLHAFKDVICITPQRGKHHVMNLHTVLFRLSVESSLHGVVSAVT